jgi:hypothetical protein
MKKFLLISCLVLLMVCFSGCGKAPEEGETAEETTIEQTTEEQAETTDSMEEESAEKVLSVEKATPADKEVSSPEKAP